MGKLTSDILRTMNFDELKKHAKELRKEGYSISGLSKLEDNKEDRKNLRSLIKNSKQKKSTECHFDNITQCQKGKTAAEVKEISKKCGVDTNIYKTKPEQCRQLLGDKVKSPTKEKKK